VSPIPPRAPLRLRSGRSFTTSYHTQFPEYVRARIPVPLWLSYAHLRRFHGAAAHTLVATPSMRRALEARGFGNLELWSRGVDTNLFRPGPKQFLDLPRPIWLYFGRVAVEKGIEDFLGLDLPGTRLVVGDGPALADCRRRFPDAVYVGYRFGAELAAHIAACDAFVFPSRTDTFGLVLLEAMACRGHALRYTWEAATRQFLGNLVTARGGARRWAEAASGA